MIAMQVDRRNKLTPWTHGGVESVCVRERKRRRVGGRWEKKSARERKCACVSVRVRERDCVRERQ